VLLQLLNYNICCLRMNLVGQTLSINGHIKTSVSIGNQCHS